MTFFRSPKLFSIVFLKCILFGVNSVASETGVNLSVLNLSNQLPQVKLKWCSYKEPAPVSHVVNSTFSEDGLEFLVSFESTEIKCQPQINASIFTMKVTEKDENRTNGLKFSSNGYFIIRDYYSPSEEFCILEWTQSKISVRSCGKFHENLKGEEEEFAECAGNSPCIPKCCGMSEKLRFNENRARNCSGRFENSMEFIGEKIRARNSNGSSLHYFRNHLNHCENQALHIYERFCFRIQEDGSLIYRDHYYNWVKFDRGNYCIDEVDFEEGSRDWIDYLGDEQSLGFVTCIPRYEYHYLGKLLTTVYGTGCIVGSFFLILTFIVYALVWKEQKLQGWITMSHCVTMFFWYSSLGWGLFLDPTVPNRYERSDICVFLAILQHYCVLSNYSWLTVISFSLFWTIRAINVPHYQLKSLGKYLIYAGFAWGVPLVIVIVSIILDQMYSYDPCNSIMVPEYGFQICFVSHSALGAYIYYPATAIMSLNFIFFSITCFKLYQYRKSTSLARVNLKKHYELFPLIARLFLLTGFIYIVELVTWCQSRFLSGPDKIPWYSSIVNIISVLQGVPIFIIYICKPNVINLLKSKYPLLRESFILRNSTGSFPKARA